MAPMMLTVIRAAATTGGMAVGFYAFHGSRKERYLQAVIGGAVGYLVSGAAMRMMPASTPTAISGGDTGAQ